MAELSRLTRKLPSHGRDNKLCVWQLGSAEEAELSKTLPVDAVADTPRPPWLLHALTVNTLNFCPFAMCRDGMPQAVFAQNALRDAKLPDPILVTVPNTVDSGAVCSKSLDSFVNGQLINSRLMYTNCLRRSVLPQYMQIDPSPLVGKITTPFPSNADEN